MEHTYLTLYKLMQKHYDNIREFSKVSRIQQRKLHRLFQGKRKPNLEEIDRMADALQITPMKLVHIFLEERSPNG